MGSTKIEWCDETQNPISGCTKISAGCTNCYAEALHTRRHKALMAGKDLPECYRQPFSQVTLFPKRLKVPNFKTKRIVFLNSMGDLFHKDVPDSWLDAILFAVALRPNHTFVTLTKRSDRMLEYFYKMSSEDSPLGRCHAEWGALAEHPSRMDDDPRLEDEEIQCEAALGQEWPLENLWLGVSVENQEAADLRLPDLLLTPAAHRLISVEPMIGPVVIPDVIEAGPDGRDGCWMDPLRPDNRNAINWVICGAETGPGARPMNLDWARSLRDQCAGAGVPFFLKQVDAGKHNMLDGQTWQQFPKGVR